ncbi:hypothetical protein lerEdw1_018317 [Lerista edwardsae]|nr:hypothetical protein lerEdw1_018317 [Lerista edwardsae]
MVSPTECFPHPIPFSKNNAGCFACVMTPVLHDPAMPTVWMGRGVAPGRLFLCCIQERERMAAVNPGVPPPAGAGGPGMGPGLAEGTDTVFVALSAGFTALSHPLVYVKLLMQVRRLDRKPVAMLVQGGWAGFGGKSGLSLGRLDMNLCLQLLEETCWGEKYSTYLAFLHMTYHEMVVQCVSRIVSHPFHVISMRCMVQFIGREVKYSGVFSSIGTILKEEGFLGLFTYIPKHSLGLKKFSQASVIRSYTKFVMGIAVSMLTYPFLLVGDLMIVNNCGYCIVCMFWLTALFACVGYEQASFHMPLCFLLGCTAGDTSVLRMQILWKELIETEQDDKTGSF